MIRRPSQPWPWNTIPTPRPADWGVGMTVCIAGICEEDGGAIVTASDRMVSMGGVVSGDDAARKLDPIRRNWTALLAGNDISPAVPIISRIRAAPRLSAGETLTNVATLVKTAFRDQRLERIEDEVLGAYGWDWQSFRKEAPTLAASVYERIQLEIHDYALSLEFLVAGFDPDGEAHIFTVSNPGRCEYFDKVGFWAIGSGQQQAVVFSCA